MTSVLSMAGVLSITTSVLLYLCLQTDSIVSARIEVSIAKPQSKTSSTANHRFLSSSLASISTSTKSSLSAIVRHRREDPAISILNRINIRGGHKDLREEKVVDSTDHYDTESNSESVSNENTDGDADAMDENYHINKTTEVSSSADAYDVVQAEMSDNDEQQIEGDVTSEGNYKLNDDCEDVRSDVSDIYDLAISGDGEEIMLGLDRELKVDNNGDHRESFPDESDSFVGAVDDQHVDIKVSDTELDSGVKSSDGEEITGEDDATTYNGFSSIANNDDDITATDNTINIQEEIEEEIMSNEHQVDSFSDIQVVEVTGEEGDDVVVSSTQEHGNTMDRTDEIITEDDDPGEEGDGIALVSADEMDDDDEGYPSGSDSTIFVDRMDLAESDSTAFVDRMDLADAYDDEDALVEMDNNDETANVVVETDIDDSGVALGHGDSIDSSFSVELEDRKVELSASSETGGVQYMITQNMRTVLRHELGYTAQEVNYMKPNVAAVVVSKMLRRPETGMPLQFYTEEGLKVAASSGKRTQLLEAINRVWRQFHTPLLVAMVIAALGGGGKVLLGLDVTSSISSGSSEMEETKVTLSPTENEEAEGEDSDGNMSTLGVPEREHETLGSRRNRRENLDETWLDRGITTIQEKIDDLLKRTY